jgi:hypothetical protein
MAVQGVLSGTSRPPPSQRPAAMHPAPSLQPRANAFRRLKPLTRLVRSPNEH